jgi:putative membrane protein
MMFRMHTAIQSGLLAAVVVIGASLVLKVQGQEIHSQISGAESPTTASDRSAARFIKAAARDSQMEGSLAQVGTQKAQNPDLKSFCEKLQLENIQAEKRLEPLVQKYNVNTEQTTSAKREISKLEKENAGAKLDQQLATELLRGHQKDITKFEEASAQIEQPDVKWYIDKTLPKLRENFEQAQTVARSAGVDESAINSVVKKISGAVGGTEEEPGVQQGAGAKELIKPTTPPSSP